MLIYCFLYDRRLDQWITYDKIQIETLEKAATTSTDASLPSVEPVASMSSSLIQRRSSANLVASASDSNMSENNHNNSNDDDDELIPMAISSGGGNWHPQDPSFEKEHEEMTKIKNVERIIMGHHAVECWYYSPFPEQYSNVSTLYVCEYCLSYMKKRKTFRDHRDRCRATHPPGKRIYLDGDISVYEMDGKDHMAYCQKLCLIAKLFLDHKTLYYDVNPFMFYIICRVDKEGSHMVGYFSKEKVSEQGYNLACILTLPQYQLNGYGKFIIR